MIFPFYMKFRVIIVVAYNRIEFYIIWHICKILHDYLVIRNNRIKIELCSLIVLNLISLACLSSLLPYLLLVIYQNN